MLIAIISAVAAIIGTAFVIFMGLRTKQAFRPVLSFNIGLLYADQDIIPKSLNKAIEKNTISTLIYGASVPQNSEIAFICPYLMINNSKLPISNIILQLEYSSKHSVKNEEKIIGTINKDMFYGIAVLGSPPEYYKYREVRIIDSIAQVRYTIPVLRPGEKIVVSDPIRFTIPNLSEKSDKGDYVVSTGLAKKLREIKKLCDFCVVDVYVYSENCPPLSKRIKLLWFDTNSTKELSSLASDTVDAFWGGKWPKPGLYWRFWPLYRTKLIVEEYGEAIIPKLKRVEMMSKDRYFYWENLLESERNIFILKMPPWNYYQLSGNIDTDDLIIRSGFQRIYIREHIEKLRNIFKRLRK